jgi:leucyl-tRNA synthetase
MMTISMDKGTGVVTSVPSDAPDDWAVEIMNIPGFGNLAALKACEDLKIKGQNDKALLAQAKDLCYKKGFYEGKMLVGKYAGSVVKDAKDLVKKDLV